MNNIRRETLSKIKNDLKLQDEILNAAYLKISDLGENYRLAKNKIFADILINNAKCMVISEMMRKSS